ncbi:hypothetical protein TSAR_008058 [Trichomalopsis sarcophagae]|uniref:Uncharacterized protein n=1 Tax=Trichomalopsis sarcophagae TaxID=543379 RepID=A0A232FPE7_9HYME|nr:hypothetical protein TSAR_008058 [Trichomalopsis sarcophagae]
MDQEESELGLSEEELQQILNPVLFEERFERQEAVDKVVAAKDLVDGLVPDEESVDGEPELVIAAENIAQQPDNGAAEANNHISTGLLQYMKKNTIGKEILKAYEKSKPRGILPRTIRSKLVRLVIARERDWLIKDIDETQQLEKFVITRERFEILANEIVHIFKGESTSTYFVPFIQEGRFRNIASGKLWNHYNYAKECLRKADLLPRRKSKPVEHSELGLSEEELQQILNPVLFEERFERQEAVDKVVAAKDLVDGLVPDEESVDGEPELVIAAENIAQQPDNGAAEANNHISTGLLQYMKKNTIGKEILKAYEKSKPRGILPRTIRSKLVRLVIARERDWLIKDIDETQHNIKLSLVHAMMIFETRSLVSEPAVIQRQFIQTQKYDLFFTEKTGKKLPSIPSQTNNILPERKPASLPMASGRQLPNVKSPVEENYYNDLLYNEDYNYAYDSQDNLQHGSSSNSYVNQSLSKTPIANIQPSNHYTNSFTAQLIDSYKKVYENLSHGLLEKTHDLSDDSTINEVSYDQPSIDLCQNIQQKAENTDTYSITDEPLNNYLYKDPPNMVVQDYHHNSLYTENTVQSSNQSTVEDSNPLCRRSNYFLGAREKTPEESHYLNGTIKENAYKKDIQFENMSNDDKYQEQSLLQCYYNNQYKEQELIGIQSDKKYNEQTYENPYIDEYSNELFFPDNQLQDKCTDRSIKQNPYQEDFSEPLNVDNQYLTYDNPASSKGFDTNNGENVNKVYNQFEATQSNDECENIQLDNQYQEVQHENQYNVGTSNAALNPYQSFYQKEALYLSKSKSKYEELNNEKDLVDCISSVKITKYNLDETDSQNHMNKGYHQIYQNSFNETFENTDKDRNESVPNIPELSVTLPLGQTKSDSLTLVESNYFYVQQNSQEISNFGLERRKKLSKRNVAPLLQQNTDSLESKDDDLKDSFETAVSSSESCMLKNTFNEYSTAEQLSTTPANHSDSFQKQIQPSNSMINNVNDLLDTMNLTEEETMMNNLNTDSNQSISNEFYQEEVMEDEEYSELLLKELQRKDSQLSHISHQSQQSQFSQNSSQHSQKPKLTRVGSYASDHLPDDSYDRRNSYIQTTRKDSHNSINYDIYSKPIPTRTDSYQSKEHRTSNYGLNFTAPQPISRAESYQRGYFNDQESIDETDIVLGSAVNSEYKMTNETLESSLKSIRKP